MYNECRHIFTSGKKCQSPALKAEDFCYFHHKSRRHPSPQNQPYEPYTEPKETTLDLSPLEDADAIQLAITDVVLALAANRIDSRRARILIYGLQVASQNNRHRAAMAAKEAAIEQTVREAHQHEDGTLIGPEKQSPEPEEAAARKRPPSLGEILLREAEEFLREAEELQRKAATRRAQEAEEEVRRKTKAEDAAQSAEHTKTFRIPNVHAVAERASIHPGHPISTGPRQVLPCYFRTSRKLLRKGRLRRSTCNNPESWLPKSRTCPSHR
jgi:hypothetical protein